MTQIFLDPLHAPAFSHGARRSRLSQAQPSLVKRCRTGVTLSISAMSKALSPSFIVEVPLWTGPHELRTVDVRLKVGWYVYNACLLEASRRLRRLRGDPRWAAAGTMPTTSKQQQRRRARTFRRIRAEVGFSDYALQHFAISTFRRARWMANHLETHEVQKLGTRAYLAANRILLGQARRVRFKGRRQFDTLEGKSNKTGIRWRGDHIEWHGLILPARIDRTDPVIEHALRHPVKYVRIVRRRLRGMPRLYAQLVCKGHSYRKPTRPIGEGDVGIDVGPSTIAVVGPHGAMLIQFCEPVVRAHQQIGVLQRRLDHQRRANNPDNYLPHGQVKPGPKDWQISHRMRASLDELDDLYRRERTHRKSLHGQLANQILGMGRTIHREQVSGRALQRRFGRSVSVRAPGIFLGLLGRKAESAGGQDIVIPAGIAKLSQVCHHCGTLSKKSLHQRVHQCACGVVAQRDLYSAFLAWHTGREGVLHADQARAAWSGADPLLRAAWSQAVQPANGRRAPSTFGRLPASWSQSGSLAAEGIAKTETRGGTIAGEVAVVSLRTPRL